MQSPRQLESIRCEAPLGTGDSQCRHPVEHFISSPFFISFYTVHGTEEEEKKKHTTEVMRTGGVNSLPAAVASSAVPMTILSSSSTMMRGGRALC